jgi:FkbM family methyltransferase
VGIHRTAESGRRSGKRTDAATRPAPNASGAGPEEARQPPFVSYAQNFEDVLLWRALGRVENGRYVDIGAQDPVVDSVSLAFYERGWRGIHVEPNAAYARKLRESRPDEAVVQAAIASRPGSRRFFEIPGTGLSTLDEKIAARHAQAGFEVSETRVQCVTLDAVLEQGRPVVHWLKIDVEGFERQVLAGWRSSPLRPWVVVIESTRPMTVNPSHRTWERLVIAKGYRFAHFDGLNRYYVAKAHSELMPAFSCGPNLFDEFAISGTASSSFAVVLKEKIQAAQAQAEAARASGHSKRDAGHGRKGA